MKETEHRLTGFRESRKKTLEEASPQELNLELMRRATFNDFDGDRVVADLLAHPNLWRGVVMDRFDLIKLRDLPEAWNVDTVFILATQGSEEALESLARKWEADEVSWVEKPSSALGSYPAPGQVLRVWWD